VNGISPAVRGRLASRGAGWRTDRGQTEITNGVGVVSVGAVSRARIALSFSASVLLRALCASTPTPPSFKGRPPCDWSGANRTIPEFFVS
jgi:hypothetical protein